MPERVAAAIADEGTNNSLEGSIPKLARLLEHDRDVEVAYLCNDAAVQVYKLPDEGAHFCGYRNMQMLLLALGRPGGGVPAMKDCEQKRSISQLQDMIEEAWTQGHNAHGRLQTGGIRGTRKHVGTSEVRYARMSGHYALMIDTLQAEALLLSLNISCTGTAFTGKEAWRELLGSIETYFASPSHTPFPTPSANHHIHITTRFPIFLQRPAHSLTIVGIERTKSGKRRLLTFDPAWRPPSAMREELQESNCSGWSAKLLLGRYRKGERYLRRFGGFETLCLD